MDLYVSVHCKYCKHILDLINQLGINGAVAVRYIDGGYPDAAQNRSAYMAMKLRGTPTLVLANGHQYVGDGPVSVFLQGLARSLGR